MTLTVLQVLPALDVGGVERGTLEIAKGLVDAGHRSIVVSGGGRLVERLTSQGSEHITLPIGEKSLLTFLLVKKFRQLLRDKSVNVLHVRSRMPAWISYMAWKGMDKDERPKLISTVHGPYSVNAYSKIMVRSEEIIVISQFIKNYVINNYKDVNQEKLTVIHRGIDIDEFPFNYVPDSNWQKKWADKYAHLKNKLVLTLPARITRWKGPEDFLLIINKLKQAGLPVHGLIAGGPHPKRIKFLASLQDQVQRLGIQDSVSFIGHRDDLKEVMAISNIVLSLAKEPEAFGRTALESLSLGTPVVAYDHGGASEVLGALFPAGLVEANNIDAATKKIMSFYQSTPAINQANPFTRQGMIAGTIGLYEKSSKTLSA